MLTKLKQRKEGFTIIEVLIVLAIAGLILLVVFLAVPALQRNARNTSRKQDVSRLAGAATDFVSNNDGTLPSTTADLTTILNQAGKLGQYSLTVGTSFTITGTAAQAAIAAPIEVQLVTGATCAANGTTVAANARQMALQYTIEKAGGITPLCLNVN